MVQLDDYDCFHDQGKGVEIPKGFKKIRVHLIYDVKDDGRHKARLVADGHLTNIPVDSVYSGVVTLQGLRLLIFLAELNHLQTWATDIGNAFLEALTLEKVCIIAGPEFGNLQGHVMIIYKALYGLGMDLCGTVYHGFVVSKHLAHFDIGHFKVSKSVAEIDDLLNACPGSNKLRPIGSRFDSGLLLGVPINRCSIEKVKDPSD
jgi:hypothetical protein